MSEKSISSREKHRKIALSIHDEILFAEWTNINDMELSPQIKIIDVIRIGEYEKYLYTCLAPVPFRRYSKRQEYLEKAISKRFHKKLLIFNGEVVGR